MKSVNFQYWGSSPLCDDVAATLSSCRGLTIIPGGGPSLLSEMAAEANLRRQPGVPTSSWARLSKVSGLLTALATGHMAEVCAAGEWTRTQSGRIQSASGLQGTPRRLRRWLRSSIPGHQLIDVDYVCAHPTIADSITKVHECARIMSPAARRQLAANLGLQPTPDVLRLLKVGLLACMHGSTAPGLHRKTLGKAGLDIEQTRALYSWFLKNTRRFHEIWVSYAKKACDDWAKTVPAKPIFQRYRQDGIPIYFRPKHKKHWRGVLANALQNKEAEYMDRVLARLPSIQGCHLVLPMYDGLLVSAPWAEAQEVATRLCRIMQEASGHTLRATHQIQPHWP